MARLMSDAEIRRRKKLQGQVSRTTSTMGLTGLGVTGVAALASRKPGVLRAVQNLPKMKGATPEKMRNAAINTGIVSGGISGVGGYNFAAYTGAESRKRKQLATPVKKELGMDMGYYGEEGRPIKLPEIKVPIEKAWEPVAGNFDSERSRKKRAKAYEGSALVGAGAAGAYSAHQGTKAVHAAKDIKVRNMAPVTEKVVNSQGDKRMVPHWKSPGHLLHEKAIPVKGVADAAKHGGKALGGAAAVGAAAGIHGAIKRKRKGSWQPYAKRDATSAFGVDHSLDSGDPTD